MRKAYILLVLGIWIAVLPSLGFPSSWKSTLFVLTGFGLIFFSYLFYRESNNKETEEKTFDNFRENNNFNENKSSEKI